MLFEKLYQVYSVLIFLEICVKWNQINKSLLKQTCKGSVTMAAIKIQPVTFQTGLRIITVLIQLIKSGPKARFISAQCHQAFI